MQKGLTPGNDSEAAGVGCGIGDEVFYLSKGVFVGIPAIFYIAPDTADITTAKTDDEARELLRGFNMPFQS